MGSIPIEVARSVRAPEFSLTICAWRHDNCRHNRLAE
jgi:hypothetical protein